MEENKPKKTISNMHIVGINLAILVSYTIIFRFINGGFIFDAFFIGIQFLTCLIAAMVFDKGIWVLSAFVVVLIGLSTCAEFLMNGTLG